MTTTRTLEQHPRLSARLTAREESACARMDRGTKGGLERRQLWGVGADGVGVFELLAVGGVDGFDDFEGGVVFVAGCE
jgi:hypothetical protein